MYPNALPSRGLVGARPALEPAPGPVGGLFALELAGCAHDTGNDLEVRLARVHAGRRDDVHAEILQLLDAAPLLGLFAPQALEILGEDRIELTPTSGGEHALIPGALRCTAGDRRVGVTLGGLEALALGDTPADAQLVLDAGLRLLFRAEAGVDGGFHLCFLAALKLRTL
jgi:hypothetical protein